MPPPPTISSPQIVTNNYNSNGQYIYQIDGSGQEINAREYLRCFGKNSNSNSIFRVRIYVDQPIAGVRSINLNASQSSSPGHVYIGLEEYTDGKAIVRNVGYYPVSGANFTNPDDKGKIKIDDRPYDVSLTVEVKQGEFMGIVTVLMATANSDYNLNTNNCTHYVINGCSGNGIELPRTIGAWFRGGGLNPSDLGEDIRSMSLTPKMTRNPNGGYPALEQGGCP